MPAAALPLDTHTHTHIPVQSALRPRRATRSGRIPVPSPPPRQPLHFPRGPARPQGGGRREAGSPPSSPTWPRCAADPIAGAVTPGEGWGPGALWPERGAVQWPGLFPSIPVLRCPPAAATSGRALPGRPLFPPRAARPAGPAATSGPERERHAPGEVTGGEGQRRGHSHAQMDIAGPARVR
ncbi:acidic proline-rich protein PRP25-like [Ochotona princeps]|uniref:acidic proline-rich protein PRP25-like n=1 Tax=Ochotona princeps TaxID=9978 RepID=UPI002714C97A|nr:acidic proline-rich protein PRP25-like [Ochotona princeps]